MTSARVSGRAISAPGSSSWRARFMRPTISAPWSSGGSMSGLARKLWRRNRIEAQCKRQALTAFERSGQVPHFRHENALLGSAVETRRWGRRSADGSCGESSRNGRVIFRGVSHCTREKFVGARQLVRRDGGRMAHIAGPIRCKLPRCAHQLASAYKNSGESCNSSLNKVFRSDFTPQTACTY